MAGRDIVALVTLVTGAGPDSVSHAPGARLTLPDEEAERLVLAGFAAELVDVDPIDAEGEPLDALTKAQLIEVAKAEGVEIDARAAKAEIVAAIEAARAAEAGE